MWNFLCHVGQFISRQQLVLLAVILLGIIQLMWIGNNLYLSSRLTSIVNAFSLPKTGTRAAMYTPDKFDFNEDTLHFLNSALVLQDLGYMVTFLLPFNQTLMELREISSLSKIEFDYRRLAIEFIEVQENQLVNYGNRGKIGKGIYQLFYAVGKSKLPIVSPLGEKFNIYMCQFPFDYSEEDRPQRLTAWQQYDTILLTSRFSHQWYSDSAKRSYRHLLDQQVPVPSISILFPPVLYFRPEFVSQRDSNGHVIRSDRITPFHLRDMTKGTFNIIIFSDFIFGRRNNGHRASLRVLERVIARVPTEVKSKVRMMMVGMTPPDALNREDFEFLQSNASMLKLPVEFVTNASPHAIEQLLQVSHVLWHLPGVDIIADATVEPVNLEPFATNVVKAMSTGCIPILLSEGSSMDIVNDGRNGFLAKNEEAFVTHTLNVMHLSGLLDSEYNWEFSKKLQEISEASVSSSHRFHPETFRDGLYILAQRGVLSHRFREVMQTSLPFKEIKNSVSNNSTNVAMIVAANVDSTFKAVVYNVVSSLPGDWGLVVVYSAYSELFVKYALRHIANVRFIPLPASFSITSVSDYNEMMFSATFWRSVQAKKVLLFQSDSIILHKGLEPFMKYDYIGAPWNVAQNKRVRHLIQQGLLKEPVGNGGFSLRSTEAMIRACEQWNESSIDPANRREQEDLFFSRTLPVLGYNVAPVDVAYQFCVEVPLQGRSRLFHEPLALHSAWYYWNDDILEKWYAVVTRQDKK
jgi:glycosyltransferase involved in cell wall biosynthesis